MPTDLSLDPLPIWIAAALLACLFAHAAIAKWADLALLEQHLWVYGVPPRWLPAATRLLPPVEALAAALLLSPWRAAGAALAALLLLAYAGAMAYHRWQRHTLDCGCGGEPLPVSWALVARNLGLAALALLAALSPGERSMGLGDFAVAAAALLLATLLYAAFHQVLRHQAGTALSHHA